MKNGDIQMRIAVYLFMAVLFFGIESQLLAGNEKMNTSSNLELKKAVLENLLLVASSFTGKEFKDYRLEGMKKLPDENGCLRYLSTDSRGETILMFHANVLVSATFTAKDLTGWVAQFDQTGKLVLFTEMMNRNPDGTLLEFFPNSTIKRMFVIRNGSAVERLREWGERGDVIRDEILEKPVSFTISPPKK